MKSTGRTSAGKENENQHSSLSCIVDEQSNLTNKFSITGVSTNEIVKELNAKEINEYEAFLQYHPIGITCGSTLCNSGSETLKHIIHSLPAEKGVEFACSIISEICRITQISNFTRSLRGLKVENSVLRRIETFTCSLFNVSSCRLFTLHPGHNQMETYVDNDSFTLRVPIGRGIVGSCASCCRIIVLDSCKSSPAYDPEIDEMLKIGDSSIMLVPIFDISSNFVNGILLIYGPKSFAHFTAEDKQISEILSNEISPFITTYIEQIDKNSVTSTRAEIVRAVNDFLGLSTLEEHAPIQASEISCKIANILSKESADISNMINKSATPSREDVTEYSNRLFSILSYTEDERLVMIMKMFISLNLVKNLNIPVHKLARYVYTLRSCYNITPYHNWTHACDVFQFVYSCIVRGNIKSYLSDLEIFALLMAALSHDADHHGLNNIFNKKARTPLGILYSDKPVMEMHHCSTSIHILSMPEYDVLENIKSYDDRLHFFEFFIKIILATDMDKHSKYIKDFDEISQSFDKLNSEHRLLLSQIIMKCGDLSNTTRSFDTALAMSLSLTEESFRQGDLERKLGFDITAGCDRSKFKHISFSQVGFYSFVAGPLLSELGKFIPSLSDNYEQLKSNQSVWEEQKRQYELTHQ